MADVSERWLVDFVARADGVAGTVHACDGSVLHLRASHNIPPAVVAATATIPKGKGMAGLAWERGVPVQTCNLETDETGDVRPGARAVDARAAIAIPVFDGDRLVAVVGVAFDDERELDESAVAALSRDANRVPR